MIDNKNQEIRPENDDVYTKMEDLADDLPESSPRFILLSYPMTVVSARYWSDWLISQGERQDANVDL